MLLKPTLYALFSLFALVSETWAGSSSPSPPPEQKIKILCVNTDDGSSFADIFTPVPVDVGFCDVDNPFDYQITIRCERSKRTSNGELVYFDIPPHGRQHIPYSCYKFAQIKNR